MPPLVRPVRAIRCLAFARDLIEHVRALRRVVPHLLHATTVDHDLDVLGSDVLAKLVVAMMHTTPRGIAKIRYWSCGTSDECSGSKLNLCSLRNSRYASSMSSSVLIWWSPGE